MSGCQSVTSGTLSNLPENVINAILMCLPLRDAVRTSVLSKKWRYTWSKLAQLTLDQTLWETTKDLISPSIKFTNIIFHLLTLHSGPVTKFKLSSPDLGNCPKFDIVIYFLSKNGIQELELQLPKGNLYKLPSSFFTCLQMRHLTLENCIIDAPPAFKGFNRLVYLKLYQVTITPKLVESLVTHSPLLEFLGLEGLELDVVDHIQINAPKLLILRFRGRFRYISLKDVPLLEDIYLQDESGKGDFVKFSESCPSLKYLQVHYGVVEFFAAGEGEISMRLPSALNCLKRLCLSDITLSDSDEVSGALCLIRSSPHLQDLKIKVFNYDVNETPALKFLEVDSFLDVTFNRLKTVKLEGIIGIKPEIQLIKLLLAKSPVLEKMHIEPGPEDKSPRTRLQVLAELIKFRRASTNAEVVYNID